jgi:hypothetical protein
VVKAIVVVSLFCSTVGCILIIVVKAIVVEVTIAFHSLSLSLSLSLSRWVRYCYVYSDLYSPSVLSSLLYIYFKIILKILCIIILF